MLLFVTSAVAVAITVARESKTSKTPAISGSLLSSQDKDEGTLNSRKDL
jgi:hypothetical protein